MSSVTEVGKLENPCSVGGLQMHSICALHRMLDTKKPLRMLSSMGALLSETARKSFRIWRMPCSRPKMTWLEFFMIIRSS